MPYIWGDRYIFTDNALKRMNELKISRDKVKNVLQNYNRAESSKVPGFKNYSKIYDNYEVGVVAKKGFLGLGKVMIVAVWYRSYRKKK